MPSMYRLLVRPSVKLKTERLFGVAGISHAQQPCVTSYQSAARNDELTYVAQAMEVCDKL